MHLIYKWTSRTFHNCHQNDPEIKAVVDADAMSVAQGQTVTSGFIVRLHRRNATEREIDNRDRKWNIL